MRRALVAAGAAGAMVAGLGVAGLVGASAAGASTGRAPVTYRVDSDGQIHGPGHLAPGRVAFKLQGYASQQLQLVKPFHANYSKSMLIHDASAAVQQGKPGALEGNFALIGGASPHNVGYLTLESGKYYALDVNASHLTPQLIRTITVSGKRKNAHIPSGPTVVATGMHTWGHAPASIPQHGVLHFANKSSDWHFIEIDRLKKGKTFADVKKVLKGQEDPSKVFTSGGKHNNFSEAVVSPGRGEASSYFLNKGNYAILCFFPDHRTGTPHAFEGMARGLKVK